MQCSVDNPPNCRPHRVPVPTHIVALAHPKLLQETVAFHQKRFRVVPPVGVSS